MLDLHPTYQVDKRGKRLVVLTEEEYEDLLAWAELNAPDPDAGLQLRPEFETEMQELDKRIKEGRVEMIPWEQVKRELKLD